MYLANTGQKFTIIYILNFCIYYVKQGLSPPFNICGNGVKEKHKIGQRSCRKQVGNLETELTSNLNPLPFFLMPPTFLQTENLLQHLSRHAFNMRKHKRDQTSQSRKVLLLHKSHQYKHHFCLGSKEFRLSPCRTWQKKIQSSQPCSTVYIDLPLEAKRSTEDMVKRKSQENDMTIIRMNQIYLECYHNQSEKYVRFYVWVCVGACACMNTYECGF